MTWRNLKFGKKLTISFGVILLLFVIIGIIDIHKTTTLLNNSKRLHDEYLPISTISTQISEIAQKAMYAQRAYRYTEDEQYLSEGKILLDSLELLLGKAKSLAQNYPQQKTFINAVANTKKAVKNYRALLAETVLLNRELVKLREQQEDISVAIIEKAAKPVADCIMKSSMQYQKYRITGNDLYLTMSIENNRLAQTKGSKNVEKELSEHHEILLQLEKKSARVATLGLLRRDASNEILKDFYSISKDGMEATWKMSNATAELIIQSRLTMVSWFGLILIVAAILAFIITVGITRPLNKCIAFAQQIASGNFDATIQTKRTDETGILMDSLNTMGQKMKEKIEEIEAARHEAVAANHLKSAFLANLSHEIRTPMNAIIGFSALLSNDKLTDEKKIAYINSIQENGTELLKLISDLIDISTIEARQIKINKTQEVVDEFLRLQLGYAKGLLDYSKKTHINLITTLPADYTPMAIMADFTKLQQVFQNLISNAVKFTEEGEIEVGFTIPDIHTIRFFVKDSGIGIAPENFEKIFERFNKVGDQNSIFRGVGLGLSISKGLIEAMGGKIWLESEGEKGSCLFFTIPLVMVKTTQAKAEG